MTIDGIDVSHHQGRVDWGRVAKSGKSFALMKASQGVGYSDPTFATNTNGARSAGLVVGSYHFADGNSVRVEVKNYLDTLRGIRKPGDLVVLDFEGKILSNRDPIGWAVEWLTSVRAALGVMPLVYTSVSVLDQFDWSRVLRLDAGLWVAAYRPTVPAPKPWPRLAMWQHTSAGKVDGISGNVDLNVFYGDVNALRAYGGATVTVTKPIDTKGTPLAQAQTRYKELLGQLNMSDDAGQHWYALVRAVSDASSMSDTITAMDNIETTYTSTKRSYDRRAVLRIARAVMNVENAK